LILAIAQGAPRGDVIKRTEGSLFPRQSREGIGESCAPPGLDVFACRDDDVQVGRWEKVSIGPTERFADTAGHLVKGQLPGSSALRLTTDPESSRPRTYSCITSSVSTSAVWTPWARGVELITSSLASFGAGHDRGDQVVGLIVTT
jgi:hypothetical protein